jgi:hypothetical protein
MEIEPTTLTGIILAAGGAVTAGIVGVLKIRNRRAGNNGQPEKCHEHDVFEQRFDEGKRQFEEIKTELNINTTHITKVGEGVARIEGMLDGMKKR